MSEDGIIKLAGVLVPSAVTLITFLVTHRFSKRNAAKQSILTMVLEDYVMYERGRFPTNYGQIIDEYTIYHKNGGNGEVTKKVEEYKAWYKETEDELKAKKGGK